MGKLGFLVFIWEMQNYYRASENRAVPRAALWAEVAAQALSTYRAGPALSTIDRVSGRARAVLFRVVPRAANRARPIWNTILPAPLISVF
jgi:hypothetical protein